MRSVAIIVCGILLAGSAFAEEKPVALKQAPGLDKVEANCGSCHSLDYIQMNSPFPTAAMWNAEVTKMINAFGAPIDPADAKIIIDYLEHNYGIETRASDPHPPVSPPGVPTTAGSPRHTGISQEKPTLSAIEPHTAASQATRHVVLPRRRPVPTLIGLLKSLMRPRSAMAFGSERTKLPGDSYQCWQDEGYGRRTPCGGGAAGDGGGGGSGASGGASE